MLDAIKRFALKIINRLRLRANRRGFVLIVVAALIPVVLLGVRYLIEDAQIKSIGSYKTDSNNTSTPLSPVAVAVAKKYNPGIPFSSQSALLTQLANEEYTAALSSSIAGSAIQGLDGVSVIAKKGASTFAPTIFQGTIVQQSSGAGGVVTYKEKYYRYKITTSNVNHYVFMNKFIADLALNNQRASDFDKISEVIINNNPTTTGNIFYVVANEAYSSLFSSLPSGISCQQISGTAKEESIEKVSTTSTTAQVSLSGDKIKVIAGSDTVFALPASCNVDIILTIPTNAAACHYQNSDSSSSSSVTDATYVSSGYTGLTNYQATPIYQIKEAYRTFLKDNFFYTKGAYVGIVPYSGKLSIPDSKTSYSKKFPAFSTTKYETNQNTYQAYTRRGFLYGATGIKDTNLSDNSYEWGNLLTGYPIMYRLNGATTAFTNNGNLSLQMGDILSTNTPSGNALFAQMNSQPPSPANISFLTMKSFADSTKYLPNPYSIVELSDNVRAIHDILNLYNPILDKYNNSNFIFLPITWANNLLQTWTADPQKSASSEQLSSQSKRTSGRKKALILMVNKPDFFEHKELTYLGFDNDYAEISMIESDKIRFDIDYDNSSNKDIYGNSFGGKIEGHKRILKYSTVSGSITKNGSCYSVTSGKGRLTLPKKGLVTLTVDALKQTSIIDYQDTLSIAGIFDWSSMTYGNGKYAAVTAAIEIATSQNLKNWTQITNFTTGQYAGNWPQICAGPNEFVTLSQNGSFYKINSNASGITSLSTSSSLSGSYNNGLLCYDGSKYVAINDSGTIYTSSAGTSWNQVATTSISFRRMCYSGKYAAITAGGEFYISTNLSTWTKIGNVGVSDCIAVAHNGTLYAVLTSSGAVYASSDGALWNLFSTTTIVSTWKDICSNGSDFLMFGDSSGKKASIVHVRPVEITTTCQHPLDEHRW